MGYSNDPSAHVLGRPWLVFDIETVPLSDVAEYLTEPVEAPANYKDPLKIASYIAEATQRQIEKAALDLDLCEIAAIGIGLPLAAYAQTRGTTPEEDMLRGFWRFVQNIQHDGGILVGFNCLTFDLLILLRRSLYLGIETPVISVDKYRHEGVVDLADMLTFGGRMTWRSLAFYCRRFGIPYDDTIDGAEVPGLVQAGRWADVEAHVRADVAATTALAARIGLIYVPTTEPAEVV